MMALSMLKSLLTGVEFVNMEPGVEATHYEGKATGIIEPVVKARLLLNSIADLPPRIPRDVRIDRGERGLILKDFKAHWNVRPGMRLGPPGRPRPGVPFPRFRDKVEEAIRTVTGE